MPSARRVPRGAAEPAALQLSEVLSVVQIEAQAR
jgi:hypothetical protein